MLFSILLLLAHVHQGPTASDPAELSLQAAHLAVGLAEIEAEPALRSERSQGNRHADGSAGRDLQETVSHRAPKPLAVVHLQGVGINRKGATVGNLQHPFVRSCTARYEFGDENGVMRPSLPAGCSEDQRDDADDRRQLGDERPRGTIDQSLDRNQVGSRSDGYLLTNETIRKVLGWLAAVVGTCGGLALISGMISTGDRRIDILTGFGLAMGSLLGLAEMFNVIM
jgi:hypothetical protein